MVLVRNCDDVLSFRHVAVKAAPWLLLGLLSAAVLTAAQPSAASIRAWFGTDAPDGASPGETAGRASIVTIARGAVLGLAIPLCSCGALPLAITLASEGVPVGSIAAFATAAQAAGVDSMVFTAGQFGVEVAAARLVAAAILAIAAGLVVSSATSSSSSSGGGGGGGADDAADNHGEKAKETASCCDDDGACSSPSSATAASCSPTSDSCCSPTEADAPKSSTAQPFFVVRVWTALCMLFLEVAPWVGVGIVFSAGCNVWAPAGGLWNAGGGDSILKRAVLLSATVPVQLCEHGVVTVAAALAKQGVSAGTAFAFIVVGPATNSALLMLIAALAKKQAGSARTTGTFGVVSKVVAVMVAFGLALSYFVDAVGPFFPPLLAIVSGNSMGGGGGGFLPGWYVRYTRGECHVFLRECPCAAMQTLLACHVCVCVIF